MARSSMTNRKLTTAVIGKDGRSSAIERALRQSSRCKGEPIRLSDWKSESVSQAMEALLRAAKESKPDFVFVGPEAPLAAGVVDALVGMGIPCIGPTASLARLESSKAFTRELLAKHGIPGNPEFRTFCDLTGIKEYLTKLGQYVVKPDGLTGGKGVKISEAHLFSVQDGLDYCEELLQSHPAVVVEEKLDGEEFSLQSFCDGTRVVDMVPVQDHKRLRDADLGPNTGGMGSYSCEDHGLPFLAPRFLEEASAINKAVAAALLKETGEKYKGILYGGFMVTSGGLRLLEYNARFGDPETLNVLSILKTDFVEICEAIIEERLDKLPIRFQKLATVCKYIVPKWYPDKAPKDESLEITNIPAESDHLRVYLAAVEQKQNKYFMTGSRAIGFVGIGQSLEEAESAAENAANEVRGPVFHRRDIGTRELIQRRIDHVRGFALPAGANLSSPSAR
jgi:phosphoribosylamine---glycine ligase